MSKKHDDEFEDNEEEEEEEEVEDQRIDQKPATNQIKQVKNEHYDLAYEMNESEEAQSLREEQKNNKSQQKVSQSSNTNNISDKKKVQEKNYDEDENDSDDQRNQKFQKSESQQPIIMFDMNQFYNLNVGSDVKELLGFMNKFRPNALQLDTKLKPFIPAYIPSIGEVDAFIKVSRPDGLPEDLGLAVIDEPTLNGTDPSIFSLELSYKLKTKLNPNINVRSIENADKNPKQIQNWVDKISELHKQKMAPNVAYTKQMPDIESLMQIWPEGMENVLKEIAFPDEKLNISVENYAKLVCNMVDIPIHKLNNNKSVVEALHVLFTLYSEFKENQHFQQDNKANDNIQSMKFY